MSYFFFFFNDTATTEIYTLSLHDALPILWQRQRGRGPPASATSSPVAAAVSRVSSTPRRTTARPSWLDRKSTRLNSSHSQISYAVFCLKKKKIHSSNSATLTTFCSTCTSH